MIIIRYSEIGTKGKNRDYFEKKLMNNLKCLDPIKVYRRYGRIILELKENYSEEGIIKVLNIFPGVSSFSFALKSSLDLKQIEKTAQLIIQEENFQTFKV